MSYLVGSPGLQEITCPSDALKWMARLTVNHPHGGDAEGAVALASVGWELKEDFQTHFCRGNRGRYCPATLGPNLLPEPITSPFHVLVAVLVGQRTELLRATMQIRDKSLRHKLTNRMIDTRTEKSGDTVPERAIGRTTVIAHLALLEAPSETGVALRQEPAIVMYREGLHDAGLVVPTGIGAGRGRESQSHGGVGTVAEADRLGALLCVATRHHHLGACLQGEAPLHLVTLLHEEMNGETTEVIELGRHLGETSICGTTGKILIVSADHKRC